jgi:hypothetical protein
MLEEAPLGDKNPINQAEKIYSKFHPPGGLQLHQSLCYYDYG